MAHDDGVVSQGQPLRLMTIEIASSLLLRHLVNRRKRGTRERHGSMVKQHWTMLAFAG